MYVSGFYLPTDVFSISFRQLNFNVNTNFHFKVFMDGLTQVVMLNYHTSNGWGNGPVLRFTSFPVPLYGLSVFHILVTQDKFVLYINEKYCCEMMHVLQIAQIEIIDLYGSFNLTELGA